MSSQLYSLESYRLIIERALASRDACVPFSLEGKPEPGHIYLRHDVDYSLQLALDLARVNADLKVQGTFFILLRSHAYNLLSSSSLSLVRQIHEAGQHVAMHATIEPATASDIDSRLRSDFEIARRDLPFLSPVFSWHNSTPEVLAGTSTRDEVGGLINAYSDRFTRQIIYCSDSNMRHSVADFLDLVSTRQTTALQLLFHPLIWTIGGNNMAEVLAKTWPFMIREQDNEMRQNRIYQELLPEGVPASTLTNFANELIGAMKA